MIHIHAYAYDYNFHALDYIVVLLMYILYNCQLNPINYLPWARGTTDKDTDKVFLSALFSDVFVTDFLAPSESVNPLSCLKPGRNFTCSWSSDQQ